MNTETRWEKHFTGAGVLDQIVFREKGSGQYVAEINPAMGDVLAETAAKAALIEAAPDLLEALVMALPYVETALEDMGYKPGVVDKKVQQIRDALSKADPQNAKITEPK